MAWQLKTDPLVGFMGRHTSRPLQRLRVLALCFFVFGQFGQVAICPANFPLFLCASAPSLGLRVIICTYQ